MVEKQQLSKSDVVIGGCILVGAQLAASSTASCVKALPHETPSILRGLWRQVLTSFFFSIITLTLTLRGKFNHDNESKGVSRCDEEDNLLPKEEEGTINNIHCGEDEDEENNASKDESNISERVVLVVVAVLGSTLLNDAIVFALKYASSAAVMCLCNTTPIWIILYSIINCDPPGKITVLGASISLVGAIICATGESDDSSEHENENLGAAIALLGAIGGASYMTATRELRLVGIDPIILSLTINMGMAITTLILCFLTMPNGISFFSTSVENGFFGFLNPIANPAAALHSIFPDMFGNFGAMIALSYFEPLIVSLVFLCEPLNASIIAMTFVGEAPPSKRTIIGVTIVLTGCLIVLLRANASANKAIPGEGAGESRLSERRKRASVILYSQVNSVAPNITATAAYAHTKVCCRHRESLPTELVRSLQLNDEEKEDFEDMTRMSSINQLLKRSVTAPIDGVRKLRKMLSKEYGTMDESDYDTMDETHENEDEEE